MAELVLTSATLEQDSSMVKVGYFTPISGDRLRCDLCPRACKLRDGQRGLCYVRGRVGDSMVLSTWGRSSGFCVDPIEKKPLNHFHPGSAVLSFGTAGCNLTCSFCQNYDISKSRQDDILADSAGPEVLAEAALELGCRAMAFTYNEPVIFLEYARDVAAACHARGVETVAVTAGYVQPGAREDFFEFIDAANVDLKAFSEDFYRQRAGGHLQPVLDTLRYLVHETRVWVEITTLLIPGLNDSDEELSAMTVWIFKELGPHVPLHFSAFHPAWKMQDRERTSLATLSRARAIALGAGLRYVYTGNVYDPVGDATFCHGCGEKVVQRDQYELRSWKIDDSGCCEFCGTSIPGRMKGPPGSWGRRRLPLHIGGQ